MQGVNLLLATLASQIVEHQFKSRLVPLLTQLPGNAPGKVAYDGPGTWDPATHVGDLNGILICGFKQAGGGSLPLYFPPASSPPPAVLHFK